MATFKLQVLMGITNSHWVDCRRLDKWIEGEGRWVSPKWATRGEAWEAITAARDPFLNDCHAQHLLRVVEA